MEENYNEIIVWTQLWFLLQARNYFIPSLILSIKEENDIGIYGEQHLHFLQEHRRLTYINLLTSEVFNEYLSEIDKQARERFCWIVKHLDIY